MNAVLPRTAAAVAAVLLLAACSSAPDTPSAGSGTPAASSGSPAVPTAVPSASGSASPETAGAELDVYAGIASAVAPRGTTTVRTLRTRDGRTRSYRLFVPEGGLGVAPLLVALHGGLGSGAQFETQSGFDGLATSNTFLVAYPDGIGRSADGGGGAQTWNGGDCCGPAAQRDVDDVAFLRALVDDVSNTYSVDPNRVYAAGHSNGGIMALRLACESADMFAAVAVQSSALGIATCAPRRAVSLLQIHGTSDANVPIDGGRGSGLAGVAFRPAREAASTIAAANRCGVQPVTTGDTANPDLALTTWPGCPDGVGVEFLTVTGAGHAWMGHPPSSGVAERLVGTPYPGLDSSRAIWSFLDAHPRP